MLIPLTYGTTHTYFIKGPSGNILVDTDYAGTLTAFYKAIKGQGITIDDIDYVLCTHFHPDHCGLVSTLMKLGVQLLVMESQTGSMHFSDKIFARESHLEYAPIDESKAMVLTFEKSRSFLSSMGIQGEIIATLSHSEDSISVILDDGTCIVGDLEPHEYLEAYSDNEALKADWEKILSFGPKRICFAHANEKVLS